MSVGVARVSGNDATYKPAAKQKQISSSSEKRGRAVQAGHHCVMSEALYAAAFAGHSRRTLVAFAPFSDVRKYELRPPSVNEEAPAPAPAIEDGMMPFVPLAPRPVPPRTPNTARILESHRVSKTQGYTMPALAFSKSIENSRSPRIIVLSPRRPIPTQLPRALTQLPSSARGKEKAAAAGEIKPPSYLKALNLYQGDQRWLFYPPAQRERAEDVFIRRSIMLTTLPDTGDAALDPIAAARVVAARARAAERADATLDTLAGDDDDDDDGDSRSQSASTRRSVVKFDGSEDGGSPRSQRHSPLPGPIRISAGRRSDSFMKRGEASEVQRQLESVKWFRELPAHELQILMRRAKHRMVPRWQTVIREGAIGSVFFVLLKGSVQVTSTSGLNLILPAGVSFGEGALVTSVRREATVVALEPCHLVQVTRENLDGLSVELSTLKYHIIGQMLTKLRFFSQLDVVRRHALAALLEIEYKDTIEDVFLEGDAGDKFYMIIEGRVGIYTGNLDYEKGDDGTTLYPKFKRDGDDKEEGARLLGEFRHDHPYPWFGEMALVSTATRSASAIALEPTKMLTLDRSRFAAFVQIIPSFAQMFATSTAAYAKMNDVNQVLNKNKSDMRARAKAREAADLATEAEGGTRRESLDFLRFGGEGAASGAVDLLQSSSEQAPMAPPPPPIEPRKGRQPTVAVEVLENEFERAARHSVVSPRVMGDGTPRSRNDSPLAMRSPVGFGRAAAMMAGQESSARSPAAAPP